MKENIRMIKSDDELNEQVGKRIKSNKILQKIMKIDKIYFFKQT